MERRPKTSTVQIPRGLLIALAAAFFVLATTLAFLLGRGSARKEPPTPAPTMAAAMPGEPDEPPVTDTGKLAPPTTTLAPLDAPAPTPSPTPDNSLRDVVARYFQDLESIESRSKYWNDPQALAKAVMDQAGKADPSGFDKLIEANRRVRDDVRALRVPAPCAEHSRLTLALVEEGLSLLERVRTSAMNPSEDMGALSAFATAGQDLETRAKDVDALAKRIKEQFGLGE